MEHQKAVEIIDSLANGIDPNTGEIFEKNSPYNDPDIIRALFYAKDNLKKKPVKTGPERRGAKWTDEEDTTIAGLYKSDVSITEIAKTQKRTRGSIRSRLVKLGLIEDEHYR